MNKDGKTMIVYGNCQAQNLAEVFKLDNKVSQHYRVQYLSSVKGAPTGEVTPLTVAACRILLLQGDWSNPFPMEECLNSDCARIYFQSASLNFLYPFFSRTNPYNELCPPVLPWGPFPYGDDAIIQLIESGLSAADVLSTYLTNWDAYGIDLDQMYRFESTRLQVNDAQSDVKIRGYLLEHAMTKRLFYTINHPTPVLYQEMLRRIVCKCVEFDSAFEIIDIAATLEELLKTRPRGPLGSVLTPIHPHVAKHFGLTWYEPEELFEMQDGTRLSYREYFASMIAEFSRVRASRAAVAPGNP